jgi:hypothetical protein
VVDIPAQDGVHARPVEVGVLLGRVSGNLGEWLADAAAFDAAGAGALWVDCGPEPELDVLALTAALAVLTYRARLVVALPDTNVPAHTVATIVGLSHGRLALISGSGRPDVAVGAFRRVAGEPDAYECAGSEGVERWVPVPVPEGRQAWRETLADAAGRGVTGVVVPAAPRLLDILRNPEDPGDRHDLQLAQG